MIMWSSSTEFQKFSTWLAATILIPDNENNLKSYTELGMFCQPRSQGLFQAREKGPGNEVAGRREALWKCQKHSTMDVPSQTASISVHKKYLLCHHPHVIQVICRIFCFFFSYSCSSQHFITKTFIVYLFGFKSFLPDLSCLSKHVYYSSPLLDTLTYILSMF